MGSRSFDGHKVEQNLARLTGTFSVDPNDAEYLTADATVVAVVVARLTGAHPQLMKRTGIVRRTDTLEVGQFAVVKEPAVREILMELLPQLDQPDLQELPLVPPSAPAVDEKWPIEATGQEWVPPAVAAPVAEEVVVYEPPEEEVFSPGGSTERVPVGGARKNDAVLARFLEGMDK